MANRIHLFGANKLLANLAVYATLGVAAFGIYKGAQVIGKSIDEGRYEGRKTSVIRFIEEGEFDDAGKLLASYKESGALEEPDVLALNMELEKSRKRARIGKLSELIRNGDYNASCEIFKELRGRGDIEEADESAYHKDLLNISLEGMIKRVGDFEGKDRISHIEKLLNFYPNCEKANTLRAEQLKVYQEISLERLAAGDDDTSTLQHFEEFYSWLKEKDSGIIQKLDVNSLKDARDKYSDNVVKQKNQMVRDNTIHIGDRVRVVKKLGYLINDKNGYYAQGDDETIQIGSTGIVTHDGGNGGTPINVSIDGSGKAQYFAVREVERIPDKNEDTKFEQIKSVVENIIMTYNLNAEEKKDGE